jgi:predicted CoA-substrate-specific enzyme activase
MIFAGCDVGSLTAKAAILGSNGRNGDLDLISINIIRAKALPDQSALAVMNEALQKAGMDFDDIDRCCSTGYGRDEIPFADFDKSEIACHAKGVNFINPDIRAIIDIGGQDCKVIRIDQNGNLLNFKMNNRCAAGTGRFLEVCADVLGVSIEELGPLSLQSRKEVTITGQCSIFAEIEITNKLYAGVKKSDLAAAIHRAMAKRVYTLSQKVIRGQVAGVSGGVAKNIGVVKHLEKALGVTFRKLDIDPQAAGAIGAAILAKEYNEQPMTETVN